MSSVWFESDDGVFFSARALAEAFFLAKILLLNNIE